MSSQWHKIAGREKSQIETRFFIDGEYRDAVDGERFENINPANGETLAAMARGTEKDIDIAVASALKAYRSGAWSRMDPRDRMDVLYRFADLVEENAESLAVLDTLDMGKPIHDMMAEDIPAVITTIRFMAECIDKVDGSVTNTDSGAVHMIMREPLGVVGAITPLELPDADGRMEICTGTGCWEHGGAQAG